MSNKCISLSRMLGVVAGLLAVVCAVPSHAADPSKGVAHYQQHCAFCHGESGEGAMPGVPDFTRGDGLMKPDFQLYESIRQGRQVMPAFEGILSDDDIYDVIAYLRTFR